MKPSSTRISRNHRPQRLLPQTGRSEMTSSRQRKANRRNAQRSTGPRTSAGKAVSRLNARWHGLATPLRWEPGIGQEIEHLARQMTGARSELLDLARRVAEAELELRRVRQARLLLAKFPPQPSHNCKLPKGKIARRRKKDNSVEDLSPFADAAGLFDPSDFFDRYEERARSKRKFAIRDFDRARLDPRQG